MFQSSPGPRAGRCTSTAGTVKSVFLFQSSPGPRAGRCWSTFWRFGCARSAFQSSPGPRAGRCLVALSVDGHPQLVVSILARPAGRALRERVTNTAAAVEGASILARPAGRALPGNAQAGLERLLQVSILARPAGRALRPRFPGRCSARRWFQSSPGPRAGRCSWARRSRSSRPSRFNPRPARGPGAAAKDRLIDRMHRASFNPRPARGPGAADGRKGHSAADGGGGRRAAGLGVSILARPAGRALPSIACPTGTPPLVFQSSPGPRAGRCSLTSERQRGPRHWFQSSPGPRAGRCRLLIKKMPSGRLSFQSSPGPRAGRC